MDIDKILAERDKLLRRRQAQEAELARSERIGPAFKPKVALSLNEAYASQIADLQAKAEADLLAEKERLDKSLKAKQAAAIKAQRSLYSEIPASAVMVLQEQIKGATIAELGTLYDRLVIDPPAALAARQLIGAHLKDKIFDVSEMQDVGRLERRLDLDQQSLAGDVVKIESEIAALKPIEYQIANLDPIGQALQLNQRFNLNSSTLTIPSDLTTHEVLTARADLQTVVNAMKE